MDNIKFERLTIENINKIGNRIIIDDIEYDVGEIKGFIANKNNYIFIGLLENEVVAFLYGYGLERPDGKNMFYIHSVDVIPNYQGKRIGTNFINYTLDYIKQENKYYKFWVLADTDNTRAIKLYEKHGKKTEQFLFSNNI